MKQNVSATKKAIKERLALAYQIIGGIPARAIDLEEVEKQYGKRLDCGTICCSLGWLSLHPTFTELGLKRNKKTPRESVTPQVMYGNRIRKRFNGIDVLFGKDSFNRLFEVRGCGAYDNQLLGENPDLSDKQLALARFKLAHDAI